jgi:hypothetical protein
MSVEQWFNLPEELRKAVIMFRKILAEEPVPLPFGDDNRHASKLRHLSNVQALKLVAGVCRYWRRIFSTIDSNNRRQLSRLFNC